MITARGKSALVLMVVVALVAIMAAPGFALADETEAPVDSAPAEEVAAVEVTAPADQAAPALEEAPADAPPVVDAAPASSEAAPAAQDAVAKTPAPAVRSYGPISSAGKRAAAWQSGSSTGKNTLNARRPSNAKVMSVPGGGCSGTVGNYGLSAPTVTPITVNDAAATQFSWTVTYNANDGCENEALSHITLTPCLSAIDGNYTDADDPSAGSYKWDREELVEVGDVLTLVFPGTVSSGGSVGTSLVKAGDEHTPGATGPDCSTPFACDAWTLNVDITNGSLDDIDPEPDTTVTAGSEYTYDANPGTVTVSADADQGYEPADDSDQVTFAATPTVAADCEQTAEIDFTLINTDCQSWTVTVITNGTVTSPNELLDKTEVYTSNPNGTVVTAQAPSDHSPANQQGTVSGLSNTVCSTSVTLNFTPDQGCVGDCGSPPPPPPVDLCPNIDGNQAAVPDGLEVDENGDCVPPPVDLCPNIEGDQAEVPEGLEVDENGDCVEPAVLPVDVCPNVEGDQAEVPVGMTLNPVTGDCDEDEVLGEIIDRDPKPSKPEPEEPPAVAPSNVQAGVLPFTGGDLLPFLVVSLMLIALGTTLTLRRRSEAKL